jgi:NAD(P)-dependent dehydrogenase (short-subunit alcohol dehydrogenase family)
MSSTTGRRRFENASVIVTGGASGIGKSAACMFAAEGADVSIFDVQDSLGNAVVSEIAVANGRATYVHADVADAPAVDRAVSMVVQRIGKIDVLMNHAGFVIVRPFLETSDAEWQRTMQVNLMGMVHASRAVLPHMLASGKGSIVNTASISGLTASALESAYCTSKGACIQLTRSIAVEFRDRGIRCNAVCPGFVRTPHGLREIQELSALEAWSDGDVTLTQGRICEPDEVARVVLFLASDDASFINGESVVVDNTAMART